MPRFPYLPVFFPRTGGNCPISARNAVTPVVAKNCELTADDVEKTAATVMIVKPAAPRIGSAAAAIAVLPAAMTSSSVSIPKTPMAIAT